MCRLARCIPAMGSNKLVRWYGCMCVRTPGIKIVRLLYAQPHAGGRQRNDSRGVRSRETRKGGRMTCRRPATRLASRTVGMPGGGGGRQLACVRRSRGVLHAARKGRRGPLHNLAVLTAALHAIAWRVPASPGAAATSSASATCSFALWHIIIRMLGPCPWRRGRPTPAQVLPRGQELGGRVAAVLRPFGGRAASARRARKGLGKRKNPVCIEEPPVNTKFHPCRKYRLFTGE